MKIICRPMLPLLLLSVVCIDAYKPVVYVHGLFGDTYLGNMSSYITEAHPGTKVIAIDLYNGIYSTVSLWKQIKGFRDVLKPIMQSAPDGIHLLCISQGGVICRALLSTTPDHNVHTFIALSSPLAGQYGVPDLMSSNIPVLPDKEEVYEICYQTILGQFLSICQYWNDPHHRTLYLEKNNFLPKINGEVAHANMNAWKKNFLRLKKLVLAGGPDDDVITPWQSSQYGFYDSKEEIVEMRNQEFYKKDTFGLKTLDADGRLSMCTLSGVKHLQWLNHKVFKACVEEWLI